MKSGFQLYALLFVLTILGCNRPEKDKLVFSKLLVEYAENPINIDLKQPRFSWIIHSEKRNQVQTAYRIFVASDESLLYKNRTDLWDSGKTESSETLQHKLKNQVLKSNHNYFWKVQVWDGDGKMHESAVATFETAILKQTEWQAKWIGKETTDPDLEKGFLIQLKNEAENQKKIDSIQHSGHSLLLQKEVVLQKKIKSAKAFVTGVGFYEFYINGQKVGDQVLAPAKSPYHKQILYDTYDVTNLVQKGENVFGIHLGNGWYNPHKKWWQQYRMQWFGHKKAIGQIIIQFEDNSTDTIVTDESWKYADGPITFSCIYDGEVYDARLEQSGWSTTQFDDSYWHPVTVYQNVKASLNSERMPPIKVIQTIQPEEIHTDSANKRVFDMKQNFAGWVRIKVKGEKGQNIKIRFAEDIFPDGSIDVISNENAKATAIYICKGDGVETYQPHFTYFGFKYVEVSSENGPLDLQSIEGCIVHARNRQIGNFNCNNDLVNKLHKATVWSQKSNMLGYPMDCPQRDERLGWLGDAQVTAEEAMFNFDMALFYQNWFHAIQLNQDEKTGDLSIISPQPYIWDEGVEWSSTYIIMLWQYYLWYGDKKILEEHYETMVRYMEFLKSISVDCILPKGWIGDWGSLVDGWKEGEPESVPTAFYFYNAFLLEKIAGILNRQDDRQDFKQLATQIGEAYNKKYFDAATANYNDGSQMANAFPLYLGLVPKQFEQKVLQNLTNDIEKHDYHLTTGVLGTKYMPEVLAKFGRADMAWKIINQKTYPSWNKMMEKYTTMCEFWTLKQSKNHVMMGSIDAWFYKYIAGIRPDENHPAFSEFIINPTLLDGLNHAEATTETVRGKISSSWNLENDQFSLEVEVPFNSVANVFIPGNEQDILTEDGKALVAAKGVKYISFSDGKHQLKVSSGKYNFVLEND